jgi:hypothetical protein
MKSKKVHGALWGEGRGRSILLLFIGVALCGCAQAPKPVTAHSANDFLNSIGANSSINTRTENIETTLQSCQYLGLRWLRSGPPDQNNTLDCYRRLYNEAGIRFSLILSTEGDAYETYPGGIPYLLAGAKTLISELSPDALIAFEGCNEPNNWGVYYKGRHGAGRYKGYQGDFPQSESWIPLAEYHRDLYQAVKADPVLKNYPVWSLTCTGAEIDNVGLQFIRVPENAEEVEPSFRGVVFADYANCHNYFIHPNWPALSDNQTWLASDVSKEAKADNLYFNFGNTWLNHFSGHTEKELRTLPKVTTETGATIDSVQVTEEIQALMYLSCYLAQFKQGWEYTAMYILRDRADEEGNQTFGFYSSRWEQRPDGSWYCVSTPRLSAHYLHNLTTILDDRQPVRSPGKLAYAIRPGRENPDATLETVHDLLLQKSDGTMLLIVWGEKYHKGATPDEVTIQFDRPFQVDIYNPAQYDPTDSEKGTRPVKSYQNTKTIALPLLNHPYILKIVTSYEL